MYLKKYRASSRVALPSLQSFWRNFSSWVTLSTKSCGMVVVTLPGFVNEEGEEEKRRIKLLSTISVAPFNSLVPYSIDLSSSRGLRLCTCSYGCLTSRLTSIAHLDPDSPPPHRPPLLLQLLLVRSRYLQQLRQKLLLSFSFLCLSLLPFFPFSKVSALSDFCTFLFARKFWRDEGFSRVAAYLLHLVEVWEILAACSVLCSIGMKRKDGLQRVKQNQLQNLLKRIVTLTSSHKVSKVVFQENQGHFLLRMRFLLSTSQITPPAVKFRRVMAIVVYTFSLFALVKDNVDFNYQERCFTLHLHTPDPLSPFDIDDKLGQFFF
ncbi:uncharacterized protein LOC116140979 [Pistacia vera]|uniref:uncharacterized protein LOC116140979 n=1 Tax=Pistacia vera TaxID=55513 RepID=UPI001263C336|nr:uncharacterized protein LOC116140979 [Pistacia vera]